MAERFAVIIPTRNRASLIQACVQRLLAVPDTPDEIVVIDDGSTDGTPEVLAGFAEVTVVAGGGNGPSRARNRGVAASSAEWLVFLDDDDVPDEGWLTAFRELRADHPEALHLAVGYRRDDGGTVTTWQPRALGAAFSGVTSSYLAGTFAIRRSLFDDVGGFDERLRHMEFTDLALRVFEAVADRDDAVAHRPQPVITHIGRPPSERDSQDPFVLSQAGSIVLDKTRHLWDRDPAEFANQLATIGVASVRAGRATEGRRLLRRAARLRPTKRSLGRAVAAHFPPAAERLWGFAAAPRRNAGADISGLRATVIIPTYARPDLVAQAVASVRAQTHPDVDVIVVDDGSPVPIDLPADPRVTVVRQENAGPAVARNTGAAAATGDYLFFLDDDDTFTPERVAHALDAHVARRADIVVCAQRWMEDHHTLDRELDGWVGDRILDGITPHLGATSIRREVFEPFDPRFLASQDVEWWLRVAQVHDVASISHQDCRIRRHPQERHLNGPGTRVEFGYELLAERSEYFDAHPRARSFRQARLARAAILAGDPDTAVRIAWRSCRSHPTRSGGTALAAATRAKVRALLDPVPHLPGTSRSPIASSHAIDWQARRFGPPEARMVAAPRGPRLAGELAAHLGRPWAGYVRAVGARFAGGHDIEVHTAWGRFIASRTDHTLQHPSFFEGFESSLAARLLEPGMTVLDIGANRGWYTAMAATLVGDDGRVIAVEPDERMRALLLATVANNEWRHRVIVEDRAISDTSGEEGWQMSTEGSLSHLLGPGESGDSTVRTVTLDAMLADHGVTSPGFVKIDVEGAEFRVLQGCGFERFADDLPIILFEFQPEMIERAGGDPAALLAHLRGHGYSLHQIRPGDGMIVDVPAAPALPDSRRGRNLLALPEATARATLGRLVIDPSV